MLSNASCIGCSIQLLTAAHWGERSVLWIVLHSHRADIVWSHHEAELSVHYCKVTWKRSCCFFCACLFWCKKDPNKRAATGNNTTQWALSQGERGMKVHMWKYNSVQMLHHVKFQIKWVGGLPSRSRLSLIVSHCAVGYVYFVNISVTFHQNCNPKSQNVIWNNNNSLTLQHLVLHLSRYLGNDRNCQRNKDTIHNIFIIFEFSPPQAEVVFFSFFFEEI